MAVPPLIPLKISDWSLRTSCEPTADSNPLCEQSIDRYTTAKDLSTSADAILQFPFSNSPGAAQPDRALDLDPGKIDEKFEDAESDVADIGSVISSPNSNERPINSEDSELSDTELSEDNQIPFGALGRLPPLASLAEVEVTADDQNEAGLIFSNITISDDRSVEQTVNERNFHALHILRDRPPPTVEVYQGQGGNHALQDYQMQLMLLEQQNKKRLMMERVRKADGILFVPDGTDKSNDADSTQEIHLLEPPDKSPGDNIEATTIRHTTTDKGKKRKLDSFVEYKQHRQFRSDAESEKLPVDVLTDSIKLGEAHLKAHYYPGQDFDSVIQDLDLEHLQAYVDRLQTKIRERGGSMNTISSCRYQILYRTLNWVEPRSGTRETKRQLSKPFFDVPQWIGGQSTRGMFRCRIPVENLDLHLEQNKDIAFIVYQTYVEPAAEDIQEHRSDYRNKPFTPIVNESIRFVHPELHDFIVAFLTTRSEYANVLQQLQSTEEVLAPYIFCYHHGHLLATTTNISQNAAGQSIELLLKYIRETQGPTYEAIKALITQGRVTSGSIPFLFKPGDVLVYREFKDYWTGWMATGWPQKTELRTKQKRRDAELRVKEGMAGHADSSRGQNLVKSEYVYLQQWSISAWHWEFDGTFTRQYKSLQFYIIEEIDQPGNEEVSLTASDETTSRLAVISDLRVMPITHCSEGLVTALQRRGQTFWKCRERRFVSYAEENTHGLYSDERYVVDLQTYKSIHNPLSHSVGSVDGLGAEAMSQEQCPEYPFELLLPLKIRGFNLRRKKWYELMADRISDIVWRKDAFSKIVMDPKAKEIVRALITKQIAAERSTDLVAGKGNGLILLLHGGPGTGKTLTAESVAEIAEKPLYRVTCGDVGTKAENVEKYLESVFHLGKLWGCVVLLDEADVFLEQRDLKDLDRNALVSVFLRVLEYYEGILVLTSNRVGTFDDAFRSRIQLALHYPNLSQYQRARIWENFISRLGSFEDGSVNIADLRDHIDDLSLVDMNGREIRNAITTARQYADYLNVVMTYQQLKDVIQIGKRFDNYLLDLRGGNTEDDIKRDEGVR